MEHPPRPRPLLSDDYGWEEVDPRSCSLGACSTWNRRPPVGPAASARARYQGKPRVVISRRGVGARPAPVTWPTVEDAGTSVPPFERSRAGPVPPGTRLGPTRNPSDARPSFIRRSASHTPRRLVPRTNADRRGPGGWATGGPCPGTSAQGRSPVHAGPGHPLDPTSRGRVVPARFGWTGVRAHPGSPRGPRYSICDRAALWLDVHPLRAHVNRGTNRADRLWDVAWRAPARARTCHARACVFVRRPFAAWTRP